MGSQNTRTADPYILAVFRIALSLVGIGYIGAYARHLDFAWYPYSDSARTTALYVCYGIILLLFVRLLGLGGRTGDRFCSIVSFVGTSWLLNHTFPLISANEELYVLASFWCCFIPLNTRWSLSSSDRPPPSQWPVWGLGINIGAYFFTAGLDKVYDPLWHEGTGLYHAFLLPWIRPQWTATILDYEFLLRALNHATVWLELAVLPLAIFRHTRILACFTMGILFAGLIYPLRIDWIGQIGIVIPIALASICPFTSRFFSRYISHDPPKEDQAIATGRFSRWMKYLLLGATCYLAGHSILASAIRMKSCPRIVVQCFSIAHSIYIIPVHLLNVHTVCLVPKVLFSSSHLIGTWEYRVEVECADGEVIEPFPVFNPDKTGGPFCIPFGVPRFYQACIYPISEMTRQLSQDVPLSTIDAKVADALLAHGIARARDQMREPIKSRLLVSPIIVPYHYQGNVQPWLDYPWTAIRELDSSAQTGVFTSRPPNYPPFSDRPQREPRTRGTL